MFLKCSKRFKDGKEHCYWSIVENRRVGGGKGKVVQRHVLYLGEIGDKQQSAWRKRIEVFDETKSTARQMSIFASDVQLLSEEEVDSIGVKLSELSLHRPRQWGGCWLFSELWDQLEMDDFWKGRMPQSRKGTEWYHVLQTLACYSLIDPGSEWRLHRKWYEESAMGDLLGEDFRVAKINTLYRCMDKLQEHKDELFKFLRKRWGELFGASFDVLLYDLTSTYFECDPPEHESKKKFGYSRDKRSDCVQVIVALIVTPEGLPIAYEVLAGNTKDDQTLADFLKKIETLYGKANRVWVMDRGIPTEQTLQEMRASDPPVHYIVGTKRGKLTKLEERFLELDWERVRESVEVKVIEKDGDIYVLARSAQRANKERAIRQRKLKRFWNRLQQLQQMKKLPRDELLRKLGAAEKDAGMAARLVSFTLPEKDQQVTPKTFRFSLDRNKLRTVRRREGQYIIRSNIHGQKSSVLWERYIQLTEIELAFRNLKSDLNIRPIFHQRDDRIEAHIFIRFIAYCLHVTLKQRLRHHAPGLTPRTVLEKFTAIQMVDVHIPTTDGRQLILSRYTQPDKDQKLLLDILSLKLPKQPPPRITQRGVLIQRCRAQPLNCNA